MEFPRVGKFKEDSHFFYTKELSVLEHLILTEK
jgi:hypothetical protein